MKPETRTFLESVDQRGKTKQGQGVANFSALRSFVVEMAKEALDLEDLFDAVEESGEDEQVVGELEEYRQKLAGLQREIATLRAQIKKVDRIRFEIDKLHAEVGSRLLRPPTE